MQKQILYQFSIRLTCPLLNIVNINQKIQKNIPFLNVSLYLFGISVHSDSFRRFPTTSDLQFSIRELFVNISEKFHEYLEFDLATLIVMCETSFDTKKSIS